MTSDRFLQISLKFLQVLQAFLLLKQCMGSYLVQRDLRVNCWVKSYSLPNYISRLGQFSNLPGLNRLLMIQAVRIILALTMVATIALLTLNEYGIADKGKCLSINLNTFPYHV